MQPFIAQWTVSEVCSLFEKNGENIAATERAMRIPSGKLENKIKSKKWFEYFKAKYPTKFQAVYLKEKTRTKSSGENGMTTHYVECMEPNCHQSVPVDVVPGEEIPRGFRKRCNTCRRTASMQSSGCLEAMWVR